MAIKLRSDDALLSALLRFGDSAFRMCYMHTKSPKAARELLEDVFLQYCLCTKEFKDENEERFWLLRTTHKVCMDYYAAKLRRNPADAQIRHAGRNLDFVVSDELCKIMKLPYTHLTVLALCHGEEDTPESAARIIGRSTSAVTKYLKRSEEKTALSEDDLREWIQTIRMPDDMRSRIQYNIQNTIRDKHFAVNSRAKTLKRCVDRAMPYAALVIVCFCLFAVAAVRFGWLGVEYVRTPSDSDSVNSESTTVTGSSGTESTGSEQDGEVATLTLSYFIPDGNGLVRHNCTMEADASLLISKMAANGAFSPNTVLNEVRFLKNGKNVSTLKSGDMPDLQLYFSADLQTALDNGDGEVLLEAISRTALLFYKSGNITPAKLEIFADNKPVTVNGEEVNCTPLMYGELPVTNIVED